MGKRGSMNEHHHGKVIKKYREMRHVTQAKLAELWPKADGERGVSITYVQFVEGGIRQITDQYTLRKLCDVLDISHWEFGLSEYDPFNPEALPGRGKRMYDETLDTAEALIQQVWSLRCAARLADAEWSVKRLNELFAFFQKKLPPPIRLEHRYQLLSLQVQRLNAVTALEEKQYDKAVDIYTSMCESVRNLRNVSVKAIALKSLGKELERKGEKMQAISLLEDARDASFGASKQVIAFVHSYLARGYASIGDNLRFERAVNTALSTASSLKETDRDGSDFVYSWSAISAILAERSWGYLELGEPRKTLAMREEMTQQILLGQDARLHAWIPLDWARAYLMVGEIEQCVEEAREFYRRALVMQSPHAVSQVNKILKSLDVQGYSDVQNVKDFRDELHDVM